MQKFVSRLLFKNKKTQEWVLINSADKISYHRIRYLIFDSCLHKKLTNVLNFLKKKKKKKIKASDVVWWPLIFSRVSLHSKESRASRPVQIHRICTKTWREAIG